MPFLRTLSMRDCMASILEMSTMGNLPIQTARLNIEQVRNHFKSLRRRVPRVLLRGGLIVNKKTHV